MMIKNPVPTEKEKNGGGGGEILGDIIEEKVVIV